MTDFRFVHKRNICFTVVVIVFGMTIERNPLFAIAHSPIDVTDSGMTTFLI